MAGMIFYRKVEDACNSILNVSGNVTVRLCSFGSGIHRKLGNIQSGDRKFCTGTGKFCCQAVGVVSFAAAGIQNVSTGLGAKNMPPTIMNTK